MSLLKSPTTQSNEFKHEALETQSRIFDLISSLEGDENDHESAGQLKFLKASMENLMGSYFEKHEDLETEIKDIMSSLRDGMISQEQFELMLRADNERSGVIVKVAGILRDQLESLFDSLGSVIASAEDGTPIDKSDIDFLKSGMNKVLVSVESISRVAVTPVNKLGSAMESVSRDILRSESTNSNSRSSHQHHSRTSASIITNNSNDEFDSSGGGSKTHGPAALNSENRSTRSPTKDASGKSSALFGIQSKDAHNSSFDEKATGSNTVSRQGPQKPTVTVVMKSNSASQTESSELDQAEATNSSQSATGQNAKSARVKNVPSSGDNGSVNDSKLPGGALRGDANLRLESVDASNKSRIGRGALTPVNSLLQEDSDSSINNDINRSMTKPNIGHGSQNNMKGNSSAGDLPVSPNANKVMDIKVASKRDANDALKTLEMSERVEAILQREKIASEREIFLEEREKRVQDMENKLKAKGKATAENKSNSKTSAGLKASRPGSSSKLKIVTGDAAEFNNEGKGTMNDDLATQDFVDIAVESVRLSYDDEVSLHSPGITPLNIDASAADLQLKGGTFTNLKEYYDRAGPGRDAFKSTSSSQRLIGRGRSARLNTGAGQILNQPHGGFALPGFSVDQMASLAQIPGTNIPFIPGFLPGETFTSGFTEYAQSIKNILTELQQSAPIITRIPKSSDPKLAVTDENAVDPYSSLAFAATMNYFAYIAGTKAFSGGNADLSIGPDGLALPAANNNFNYFDDYSLGSDIKRTIENHRVSSVVATAPNPFMKKISSLDLIVIDPTSKIDKGTSTADLFPTPIEIPQPEKPGMRGLVASESNSDGKEGSVNVDNAEASREQQMMYNPNQASLNLQSTFMDPSCEITLQEKRSFYPEDISRGMTFGDNSIEINQIENEENRRAMAMGMDRKELPVVFDKDGLIARTYRHIQPRDLKQEIAVSQNPLQLLHYEFQDVLGDSVQTRLLRAAANDKSYKIAGLVDKIYGGLEPVISRLNDNCASALQNLDKCENLANSLIILVESGETQSNAFRLVLSEMSRILGEAEMTKVWVDVQLIEYRAMFEKANALDIAALPTLLKTSPPFERVYNIFFSCQGKSVEVGNRMLTIKERCYHYNLQLQSKHADQHRKLLSHSYAVDDSNIREISFLNHELQKQVSRLQVELHSCRQENEMLNLEILEAQHANDLTPGALMFFSALHDQSTVPVFQQLSLQLKELRGFADGSDHLDFATLRRRIQVCTAGSPSIDRFLHKYSTLYKKWITIRLGMFKSRQLTGGDADQLQCCPLCFSDTRRLSAYETAHCEKLGGEQEALFHPPKKSISIESQRKRERGKAIQNVTNNLTLPILAQSQNNPETMLSSVIKVSKSTSHLKTLPNMK